VRHSQPTVIVGQRALLREGLAALLQQSVYKVVASVAAAAELKDVRGLGARPTLVILGVEDANGSLAEATANISLLRSLFSGSRIVVVAEMRDPVDMRQILPLAPDGYIANLGSREILLKLLELVLIDQQVIVLARPTPRPNNNTGSDKCASSPSSSTSNDFFFSPGLANSLHEPQLSQREQQVLLHLTRGDSNKVIARICNIAESTVKVYLKTILHKLGAHNRTQAAIWAVARGHGSTPSDDHPVIQMDESVSLASTQVSKPVSHNGASLLPLYNVRR
jgi:two-component system nitrate/nitrite response regulator NarL